MKRVCDLMTIVCAQLINTEDTWGTALCCGETKTRAALLTENVNVWLEPNTECEEIYNEQVRCVCTLSCKTFK
jgi:hypothetical protein